MSYGEEKLKTCTGGCCWGLLPLVYCYKLSLNVMINLVFCYKEIPVISIQKKCTKSHYL